MSVVYGFSAEYVVNSVCGVRVFSSTWMYGSIYCGLRVWTRRSLARASLVVNSFVASGLVCFGCFGMWKRRAAPEIRGLSMGGPRARPASESISEGYLMWRGDHLLHARLCRKVCGLQTSPHLRPIFIVQPRKSCPRRVHFRPTAPPSLTGYIKNRLHTVPLFRPLFFTAVYPNLTRSGQKLFFSLHHLPL